MTGLPKFFAHFQIHFFSEIVLWVLISKLANQIHFFAPSNLNVKNRVEKKIQLDFPTGFIQLAFRLIWFHFIWIYPVGLSFDLVSFDLVSFHLDLSSWPFV